MEDKIEICLGNAEALVLFDLLSRELERPNYRTFKEISSSDAYIWALDGLLCELQRVLVAPFDANYSDLVSEAAANLIEHRGRLPRGAV